MKRISSVSVTVGALAVAGAFTLTAIGPTVFAQGRGAAPAYRVDPLWPQPLPNHWVFGSITGVGRRCAGSSLGRAPRCRLARGEREGDDAHPADLERLLHGRALRPRVRRGRQGRVELRRTRPGLRLAAVARQPRGGREGERLDHRRGSGHAASRPRRPRCGRLAAPAAPADAHVLKFSKTGQFLLQIGKPGQTTGDDSLNKPSAVAVDAAANEVFIADTGNRRIAVFDSETGKFKRAWGAYGEKPGADPGAYNPNAAPARQFRDVTCVDIAKDGMVYVCDRTSNRIQVFQKDGKFVKEGGRQQEHAWRGRARPVRRGVVVRLRVGRRILERRAAALPVRRGRPGQEGRASSIATRWRRPARSDRADASRDDSWRSAASRSTRRATCTRASSTTASACRSS